MDRNQYPGMNFELVYQNVIHVQGAVVYMPVDTDPQLLVSCKFSFMDIYNDFFSGWNNYICDITFTFIATVILWYHNMESMCKEWLLFNARWAIFQPYHGENKLPFDEMIMMIFVFILEQHTEFDFYSATSLKQ